MKVKELIELLSKLDGNLNIYYESDGYFSPVEGIILASKEGRDYKHGPNWTQGEQITEGVLLFPWKTE